MFWKLALVPFTASVAYTWTQRASTFEAAPLPEEFKEINLNFLDRVLENYDKRLWPTYGTSAPTEVAVELFVNSLGPLDNSNMDFRVNFYLRQSWFDPRLDLRRVGINETLMLNGDDIASQIWKPDLTFANVKVARVQEITLPTIMVKIFPDGNITYSIRLNLRLRCLMNLMLYPFDSQRCSVLIRSYAHAVEETILRWKEDPLILSHPFELPEFDLVEYFDTSFLRELPAGNFSVLEASFVFERRRGYHFLYGYLPSSLIVCGSWVLLWLKLEIPQAIAALGAVKLLAMVSLASSVRGTIPRVSYVKAIDVWFATCIMFVFALLTVATTAHYLVRVRMRPLCVLRFDHWVGNTYYQLRYGRPADDFLLTMNKENKLELNRNVKMAQALRRKARLMFPLCFALFNIVYWPFYTLRSYVE